jgi:mono/diheme cytochrome c family protein
VRWEILPDTRVTAYTYDGTVPGPEIRVPYGQHVRVVVTNSLTDPTTVHWHGIAVPNAMDGVPEVTQKPIEPGETFTYEFDAIPAGRDSKGGTFLYHSHFEEDRQVGLGLAGAFVIEEPIFKAYAKNITPDMETGIGSWTDDEIVNAIRNGQKRDGTFYGPPMSFGWYKRMSDTDVRAIVAYLRTLRPIRNEVPASTYQIPLNGFGPMVTSVPDVPKTDIVKYGEYLAGPVGHCMDCHTPLVNGVQDLAQLGRGGAVFARPFIYDWAAVSANITPHPEAGLGAWTDDEIKRAITKGISRNGRTLLPFMPYGLYDKMQPSDLDAVVAYLRSIPPLGPAAPPAAE